MKFVVFLFLLAYISANCFPESGPGDLLINEHYYVCFIINGNERSVFYPQVDHYGRFVFKDLYNKVISSQRNVTYIQVAIGTKDKNGEVKEIRSVPKLYNGLKHHNKYFNFLTAMIQVDKGVVESIKWDDGCYTCMNCEENSVLDVDGEIKLIESSSPYYQAYQGKNCYVSKSKCDSESKCDLTVYLVWSGSDAKGRVFQSANLRLSRFQSGSIENIMNAMQ